MWGKAFCRFCDEVGEEAGVFVASNCVLGPVLRDLLKDDRAFDRLTDPMDCDAFLCRDLPKAQALRFRVENPSCLGIFRHSNTVR